MPDGTALGLSVDLWGAARVEGYRGARARAGRIGGARAIAQVCLGVRHLKGMAITATTSEFIQPRWRKLGMLDATWGEGC